jgi:hypothetical protein
MKLFRGDVIVEKRRDIGGMTKDGYFVYVDLFKDYFI